MKSEDIDKCNKWFEKYGLIAAAVGRNIPIVRTLVSLPIGISRLPFKRFVLYTLIGSIPWTFVFVYFGYSLGNNWTVLSEVTSKLKIPIISSIITGINISPENEKKIQELAQKKQIPVYKTKLKPDRYEMVVLRP